MENALVVFSGKVSNLRKITGESNFFANQENRRLGMLATLGLAVMGESGLAAASLHNVSNGESQVELFCCEVAGKTVYGCFSRVFFEDGDNIDVVAEAQDDGGFYAYSVRRPLDHRLWLPFHCERGSVAHRRSVLSTSSKFTLLITSPSFLFFIAILFVEVSPFEKLKLIGLAMIGFLLSFLFIFLIVYRVVSKLQSFSFLAEKIFATLGYKEPGLLDMNHENAQFLRDCKIHGDFYYVPDTPQFRQILVAPCVYHYRHAPEIPEAFKLKE